MAAFIIYIIRWAVVLTLLYSLYGLFMKRETLHGFNRIVLLFVLVASMALPLVQVETDKGNVVTTVREQVEKSLAPSPSRGNEAIIYLESLTPAEAPTTTLAPARGGWGEAFILLYLAGTLIAWLRYLWSLASLLRLIRQGRQVALDGLPKGVKVMVHPGVKTPCSWMHWMLLSPADIEARPIIVHELSHIRLGHSWDMLLCELTCRMLWFVPFVWMLRQDLRDVHEYQADRCVLLSGVDENEYQLLLIRKATSTGLQPVVNAFNQSPIKRRFIMMCKKPSRRWVALKAAYLLPLCALALVAFARPQAMKEIEEHVEEAAPAVADAIKTVAQQLPSLQGEGIGSAELPDSNLVKADLAESGARELGGSAAKSATELLDSTMLAVGARKLAEGTYIGHFQPSLSSDTVRIARATILNRQSQQTDEHLFAQNAADPYAYNITLNAETRKDRTGYYIRYLQPVNSKLRNYDKKEIDPKMLSTDSVLTKRSNKNMLHYHFTPIAIERSKQETRIFLYIGFSMKSDTEILKQQNIHMYKNVAIVDNHTGDKYVCRSTDYSYFKHVKDEIVGKDTVKIFQTCLVFPPLGKRVRGAHFANINDEDDGHETFDVTALPRKGRVITQ